MTMDEWLDDVLGRSIGSGQCVALIEDYSTRVVGGGFIGTNGGKHPGYASSLYESYGTNGAERSYVRVPPTSLAHAGDIAVWDWGYPFTPTSHTAVVLNDAGLGVNTATQNPGVAKTMIIPKLGLLGYLRPGNPDGTPVIHTAGDTNPITSAVQTVSAITQLKEWVSDGGNWQRIGLYVLGAALILSATLYLFKDDATQLLTKVTK